MEEEKKTVRGKNQDLIVVQSAIRERFAEQSLDDIKQNTDLLLLAIKHHGDDDSKLNLDAIDALQSSHKVIQLYISGKISAYDTNKQIIEYSERVRENRGIISSLKEDASKQLSRKRFNIPLGISSISLWLLFSDYMTAINNLQKIATSSCIGALISGSVFEQYYNSLPFGKSWIEYAKFLLTIEMPTLDKTLLVENGINRVKDILTGVKYDSKYKNVGTMITDLKDLGLSIDNKEQELLKSIERNSRLELESGLKTESSSYLNAIGNIFAGTVLETGKIALNYVDKKLLGGNLLENPVNRVLENIRYFTEKTSIEITHNLNKFENEIHALSSTTNSLKYNLTIFIGILVLLLLYILIKQILKCKNKSHKNKLKEIVQTLKLKRNEDILLLQFRSKNNLKKNESKSKLKKSLKTKKNKSKSKSKKSLKIKKRV